MCYHKKAGETKGRRNANHIHAGGGGPCAVLRRQPSGSTAITGGDWSGTAGDNPLTFTVENGNTIKNMTVTLDFQFDSKPDSTVVWVFDSDITDNGFQYVDISGSSPWEFGLDIQGTFDPPGTVEGTITGWGRIQQGGSTETDSLTLSWSASRTSFSTDVNNGQKKTQLQIEKLTGRAAGNCQEQDRGASLG